ncbi:MAG: hypothetical protein QXL46_04840 [Nitrososphaerales archaeon]
MDLRGEILAKDPICDMTVDEKRQNSNQTIKARPIISALMLINRPSIRILKSMPNDFY